MPVAVFVLGILGAVFTTSMQSTEKEDSAIPILGYAAVPGQPCATPVLCDTDVNDICRLFPGGPQAKAMDSPTTCNREVYRPN